MLLASWGRLLGSKRALCLFVGWAALVRGRVWPAAVEADSWFTGDFCAFGRWVIISTLYASVLQMAVPLRVPEALATMALGHIVEFFGGSTVTTVLHSRLT